MRGYDERSPSVFSLDELVKIRAQIRAAVLLVRHSLELLNAGFRETLELLILRVRAEVFMHLLQSVNQPLPGAGGIVGIIVFFIYRAYFLAM